MPIRWKKVPYEIVKDPVYGYVRLFEHELKLINTSAMQRLRRIKQLSSAYLVYPGATHDRLSHSIGVMHVAGLFTEKLLEPLIADRSLSRGEAQKYIFLMRLWGLTHDLGHGPFSHVFEMAILNNLSISHEYLSAKILSENTEIQKCMRKIETKFGITTSQMAELLTKPREEWTTDQRIGRSENYEAAFFWVLKGFYSADSIEYLLRDALFTGSGFGGFDWQRLLFTSHLSHDRVVLEKRAGEALDAFLLSRLLMFDTVYYHRTSRAFDKILTDFLVKANEKLDFKKCVEDVNEYQKLDDGAILNDRRTKTIRERKLLLNRNNIYTMLEEKSLPISAEQPRIFINLISRKDWNHDIREIMGDQYPSNAFFIDDPNLPLNPMKDEEIVFLLNTQSGEVESRRIWETFWGRIPRVMYILRLYVNKRYKNLSSRIQKAFRDILQTEGGKFPSYA